MITKRTLYSLLLTSLLLVSAFSVSFAQSVDVESKTVLRCEDGALDITVNNPGDISAFEVVLEVSSTSGGAFFDALSVSWDAGLTWTNRTIDLSGVDNVSPDTIRLAAMLTNAGEVCLTTGQTVVAQVSFTTNNVCSGTINLDGASKSCPNGYVTGTTQFVDCATSTIVSATLNSGVVTIQNAVPSIDPIVDATIHYGDTYSGTVSGDDPDLHSTPGGCESLTYNKVSGPAAMTVNSSTGVISWTAVFADVCEHVVVVEVRDGCDSVAQTSFTICVQNTPPAFTGASSPAPMLWGGTANGTVDAINPDSVGGIPLLYSVASFDGPGTVNVNPANGDWSWDTQEDNTYIGLFTLCIAVSDGANICSPCSPSNADTICVQIRVIPTIRVTIQKTHGTLQGQHETVSIDLDNSIDPGNEFGGYDLLISYDASALNFISADPGQLLTDCGFEYFQYRYGANGNCGQGACPSGKLRLVAIAETNNGANHPSCFGGGSGYASQLASLDFLVSNDRTLECQYVPIRFCWYDCGDNAFSSVTGDTLWISRHIYDFDTAMSPAPIEDPNAGFPTYFGAQASCDVDTGDGKPDPLRGVDFWNGGIDIVCADSIDARGDLNLNGISNEIADAVVYTNYFVYGLSAFNVNLEGQIAASDVNADGLTLSVADLVYLIRIVVGDANPFPKVVETVNAEYTHNRAGVMSVVGETQMGAAFVVVEGDASPELLASDMEMRYNYDGVNTRILVYSMQANDFSGDFLQVTGDIVSIEMATSDGSIVATKELPTEFALNQNYPNPFNPSTTVSFSLPTASDYDLRIYNVNGQEVATFSGHAEAGIVELEWEASNLASGIYFYKLSADNFSDTKKMVLLK